MRCKGNQSYRNDKGIHIVFLANSKNHQKVWSFQKKSVSLPLKSLLITLNPIYYGRITDHFKSMLRLYKAVRIVNVS